MKTKNNGFTLAEVLMVLAIIGVVASMIMPLIRKILPNQSRVMFKKAYYITEKTVSNLINDDANYPSDQTITISGSSVEAGFAYSTAGVTAIPSGASKFCYLFSKQLNLVSSSTSSYYDMSHSTYGIFTTTDGVSWKIYDYSASATYEPQFDIYADVNGIDNGPNCSEEGKNPWGGTTTPTTCTVPNAKKTDIYRISVSYDGTISLNTPLERTYLLNPTKTSD